MYETRLCVLFLLRIGISRFSKRIVLASCLLGFLFFSILSYAAEVDLYPEVVTYVDRSCPDKSFVGTDGDVKVGDLGRNLNDRNKTNDRYYPARVYIKFNTDDLKGKLAGRVIKSATLYLYGKEIKNIGQASDVIQLRRVNNAWPRNNSFTWNDQKDWRWKGTDIYASCRFDESTEKEGWKTWEKSIFGGRRLYQLVQGWVKGNIPNYGVVLENDFNSRWWKSGMVNAEQLNEIEVTFRREDVYLTVSVSP